MVQDLLSTAAAREAGENADDPKKISKKVLINWLLGLMATLYNRGLFGTSDDNKGSYCLKNQIKCPTIRFVTVSKMDARHARTTAQDMLQEPRLQ